jgi:hypothetical protein
VYKYQLTTRVHRQPHEHRAEQRRGAEHEAAMRDASVEPGQGRAFERPADGDPLLFELQRNRDGDERQARRRDERQPSEVAFARRLQPQQLPQQHRHRRAEHDRDDAHDGIEAADREGVAAGEERPRAGGDRGEVRIARLAAALPEREGVGDEHGIQRPGQRQHLRPRLRPAMLADPRGDRGAGEHGRDNRDVAPRVARGQPENRRDRDHIPRRQQHQRRPPVGLRVGGHRSEDADEQDGRGADRGHRIESRPGRRRQPRDAQRCHRHQRAERDGRPRRRRGQTDEGEHDEL